MSETIAGNSMSFENDQRCFLFLLKNSVKNQLRFLSSFPSLPQFFRNIEDFGAKD